MGTVVYNVGMSGGAARGRKHKADTPAREMSLIPSLVRRAGVGPAREGVLFDNLVAREDNVPLSGWVIVSL